MALEGLPQQAERLQGAGGGAVLWKDGSIGSDDEVAAAGRNQVVMGGGVWSEGADGERQWKCVDGVQVIRKTPVMSKAGEEA